MWPTMVYSCDKIETLAIWVPPSRAFDARSFLPWTLLRYTWRRCDRSWRGVFLATADKVDDIDRKAHDVYNWI